MRRINVLLDYLLPPTTTEPASEEALNLLDLSQFFAFVLNFYGPARSQSPFLLQGTELRRKRFIVTRVWIVAVREKEDANV